MKGLTVCIVAGSLSLNLVGMLTQCEAIVLCSYFKGNARDVAQPPSISKFASGEFGLFGNLYQEHTLAQKRKQSGLKQNTQHHKHYQVKFKTNKV